MGRRRRIRNRCFDLPALAAAFGMGLIVAMFFSVRLALIIAAAALIYVSTCRRFR